jgi:hypothetical protein
MPGQSFFLGEGGNVSPARNEKIAQKTLKKKNSKKNNNLFIHLANIYLFL